jgi:probable phosphoglycerate mutase
MKNTINLYLVRHGVTDYNKQGRMQGRLDIPLNNQGIKQAKNILPNLKEFLDDENKLDFIASSPLKRAKKTAQIIANYFDVDVEIYDGLQEIDVGDYQGVDFFDMDKTQEGAVIKKGFLDNSQNSDYFSYPNGEQKIQARKRFTQAVFEFVEKHNDKKNLVIVAHGFVIKQFIIEITNDRNAEQYLPGNCGISRVFFDKENKKFSFDKIIYQGEFTKKHLENKQIKEPKK